MIDKKCKICDDLIADDVHICYMDHVIANLRAQLQASEASAAAMTLAIQKFAQAVNYEQKLDWMALEKALEPTAGRDFLKQKEELEAQCAAMRNKLRGIFHYIEVPPHKGLDLRSIAAKCVDGIQTTAGRALLEEMEQLRVEVKALKQMEDENIQLRKERSKLRQLCQEISEKLFDARKERDECRAKINELDSYGAKLVATTNELAGSVDKLIEESGSLRKECDEWRAKVARYAKIYGKHISPDDAALIRKCNDCPPEYEKVFQKSEKDLFATDPEPKDEEPKK